MLIFIGRCPPSLHGCLAFLPDVCTPFYVVYADTKEPVRDLGVSARKEFAGRSISISAIVRSPIDIPLFQPRQSTADISCHKTGDAFSKFVENTDHIILLKDGYTTQ